MNGTQVEGNEIYQAEVDTFRSLGANRMRVSTKSLGFVANKLFGKLGYRNVAW